MFQLLIKIIPLDLAATLSPGILALVIVLLASKNHPRAHIAAFFFGSLSVAISIAIMGFILGNSFDEQFKPTLISSLVDLIFGGFMVFYGIKIYFSRDKNIRLAKNSENPQILKWFILGIIISVTNFDALLLSFTAAKIIGTATLDKFTEIILLVLNIFFFTLPITLPVILYLIFPKPAVAILNKIDGYLRQYSKYIILGMFLIFGLYFMVKGAKFFLF